MRISREAHIQGEIDFAEQAIRSKGYYPIATILHGSQNYGLDIQTKYYRSDFDFVCVVVPTLWDLSQGKQPVSFVCDGPSGQIDVKDVRLFIDNVIKMNPSYLECIKTPYVKYAYPPLGSLYQALDSLLRERGLLFTKACWGMFLDRCRNMYKPTPSSEQKINQYGYDGKQAHHAYRLLLMLKNFEDKKTLCLEPSKKDKELLVDLKLNKVSLKRVEGLVSDWSSEMNALVDRLEQKYPTVSSHIANLYKRVAADSIYLFCQMPEGVERDI